MPNTSLAKELSVALSVLPGLSILATICAINYIANDNMRSGAIILARRPVPSRETIVSKKRKHPSVNQHAPGKSGVTIGANQAFDRGSAAAWQPFDAYNNLQAPLRAAALKQLGINVTDTDVLGILTKSHFVIPGKTRFECRRCGECCRYARKVAQLTYEPCFFLTPENTCSKHDNRYLVCKWFPFWIYDDPARGPLLTIKPYCSGYGKGPLVDYAATLRKIAQLVAGEAEEDDGAFVIHEVLLVPGRKDWAFPSRDNIDALIRYIQAESRKTAVEQSLERPSERTDEVHYAHHYTSGLLGSINSPLLTVNEDGIITDVNEHFCRLSNLQRPLLAGQPLQSFFINPESVAASISSCFSQGKDTASPQRLSLPDGSALPVLLNGLVYRDRSDGLVHGALFCVSAVSAAVFNEVSQSRNYARGLLEASLDALMVIDRDGAIIDVNEALVTISGRSRETLIGSPFRDLFDNKEKAIVGVDRTFKDGKVQNFELTLLNTRGEAVPVSFNATVYRDSEGVVQGIFAAARDIRQRLAMVHELEEAKNYARGLIECCIDLMVTINREGIITDANQAATVITGRKREAIIGSPFKGFFDDPQRAGDGVELTFSSGEVRNYGMNLLTAAGAKVAVSFNATLYRDSQGVVQGVFAIARARE